MVFFLMSMCEALAICLLLLFVHVHVFVMFNTDTCLLQLGTLGAGNHYAEIQVVEEIYVTAWLARVSFFAQYRHTVLSSRFNSSVCYITSAPS